MYDNYREYLENHERRVGPDSDAEAAALKALGHILLDLRKTIGRERPERYDWDVVPIAAAPSMGPNVQGAEPPILVKNTFDEEQIDALIGGKADEGWTFYDVAVGDQVALLTFRREK